MKSVLHLLNLITPTFILLVAVILHLFIKMPKACPGHKLPAWVSFGPNADAHCVLSSAIICLITCSSALKWLQLFQIPTYCILFLTPINRFLYTMSKTITNFYYKLLQVTIAQSAVFKLFILSGIQLTLI